MKHALLLAAALLAVPSIASANSRCTTRDANGSWVYYSIAGGANPYTITCSLKIFDGTISSGGQCVSSSGQTLTVSGSLTVAATKTAKPAKHVQPPLSAVNHTICTITGTISYAENSLTETLTNLTIAHDRQEIFGVGTNGTGLTSATFVNLN